jgi:hypothetical protein
MPHPNINRRVRCYNGRTQFGQILHEAKTKKIVNCVKYRRVADAVRAVHKIHEAYGDLLDQPQRIEAWLFSIIEPNQDDTDYWNDEAAKILDSGTTAIKTNGNRWALQQ